MTRRVEGEKSGAQDITYKLNKAKWRSFLNYIYIAIIYCEGI